MKNLYSLVVASMFCLGTATMNAETIDLTVNAVQAACLDTYYQTSGKWEFVLANDENVVATLAVNTAGYNHIAGQYDLAGSESVMSVEAEEIVNGGSLSVEYVSEGEQFPVYHFVGSMETAGNVYNVDLTAEVFAYDYLYYLYYEMGVFSYQQILIALDDAPDDAEHDTYEMAMTTGYLDNYIDAMGALQIRAENEDGLLVQVILDAEELLDNTTYPMSVTYAVYCYLGDMNTQTYLAYFKSGSATVKVTAVDEVSVDATLTAKGGDVYHIVMTGLECPGVVPSEVPNCLQMNEILHRLADKRMMNGKLIIERNGKTWEADGSMVTE